MKKIIIIAAVSKNNVLGNNGKIPWNYKEDMARFKFRTTGNIVIMGRKTFESIGKPLPDRFNIVVSSSLNFKQENLICVQSLKDAIDAAEKYSGDIYICGGERIYKEALAYADEIELTLIKNEFEGDAFFPEIDKNRFKEINREVHEKLDFITYKKVTNES